MPLLRLLIVCLVVLPMEDTPESLVARLGSAKFADREAASEAIEKLGSSALAALRAAKESRDLEVRTRAGALLDRIEKSALVQPTLVTLDYAETPLADLVRSLGQRSGQKVRLMGELDPEMLRRKVTLKEPNPVPFWQAIERVMQEAGLQISYQSQNQTGQLEAALVLFPKTGKAIPPVSDHGPFRVRLLGLHYGHDLNYDDGPMGFFERPARPTRPAPTVIAPASTEQCSIRLMVTAEPRLSLAQTGGARLSEARDEKGQSLLPADQAPQPIHSTTYYGVNAASTIQFPLMLVRPAEPGRRIRSLKGVVPVAVTTRKANPLLVPVAEGQGKPVQNGEVKITILGVKPDAQTRQPSVELTILHTDRPTSSTPAPEADPFTPRTEVDAQHFEVLDSKGSPIPWYVASTSFVGDETRVTLSTLPINPPANQPAQIRYYSTARATADIPFEFRDVPMP